MPQKRHLGTAVGSVLRPCRAAQRESICIACRIRRGYTEAHVVAVHRIQVQDPGTPHSQARLNLIFYFHPKVCHIHSHKPLPPLYPLVKSETDKSLALLLPEIIHDTLVLASKVYSVTLSCPVHGHLLHG